MTIRTERLISITLLLLPIITAWLFIPQIANAFTIKHHVANLGLLGLATTFIYAQNKLAVPRSMLGIAFFIWIAAVLGSALSAQNSYLATTQLIEIIAMVLMVFILFSIGELDTIQRNIETGIIIAASGVAIFALKQYFLPTLLDPGFHALGKLKIYSTLGNSSLAALVILAALPSSAWRTVDGSIASRTIYITLTLVLFSGLLATQSRHALLAVAVMGTVGLLWLGSKRVRLIVLGCSMIVIIIAIVLLLTAKLSPELAHSIKGRWFIWLTTFEMMRDHVLVGVGLGHFGLAHMDFQARLFATGQFDAFFNNAAVITEGHNEFLNWGAVTGVFGFTGFILLIASTLWQGWHATDLKNSAPQLYLALVGFLFSMLFISLLSYPATVFFFWLIFAMVLSRSASNRFVWSPGASVRHLTAVILVCLLLVEGNSTWREINAGLHEARGNTLMEQHDLWFAQKEYKQAVSWNPHNGELRKKYAMTLYLDQQLNEAIAELEEAKRNSGDLGILLLEGEIRTRQGDLEQAGTIYRKIIAAFPDMVGAHFVLGQIYQLQKEPALAEHEFRKVLEIEPSPFNLNMTMDKVELQKRIVRAYLQEQYSGKSMQQK